MLRACEKCGCVHSAKVECGVAVHFSKFGLNVVDNVANKRAGDRHKKTPERQQYMRDLMRRRRAA